MVSHHEKMANLFSQESRGDLLNNARSALLWKLGLLECTEHRFRPRLRSGSAGLCSHAPSAGVSENHSLVPTALRAWCHMSWLIHTCAELGTRFPGSHSFHFNWRVLLCTIIMSQVSYGRAFIGCSQGNLCDVGLTEGGQFQISLLGEQKSSLLWRAESNHSTAEDKIWCHITDGLIC